MPNNFQLTKLADRPELTGQEHGRPTDGVSASKSPSGCDGSANTRAMDLNDICYWVSELSNYHGSSVGDKIAHRLHVLERFRDHVLKCTTTQRHVPKHASDNIIRALKDSFYGMGDIRFDQMSDDQYRSLYFSVTEVGEKCK